MTATELAKMLNGWPEGARLPGFDHDGKTNSYIYRPFYTSFSADAEMIPAMEALIELACMSGLRWLAKQRCPSTDLPGPYMVSFTDESPSTNGTQWRLCLEWFPLESDASPKGNMYSGPTILHAIDAAIKATKGNQ